MKTSLSPAEQMIYLLGDEWANSLKGTPCNLGEIRIANEKVDGINGELTEVSIKN